MSHHFDIIIIGGGIAGLTLACALAPTDLRIAVLEKHAPNFATDSPIQQRVLAISRASENVWRRLGAWPYFADSASAYLAMEVWDGEAGGRIHFDCQTIAEANLGHIIHFAKIYQALLKQIQQHPQIHLLQPITLTQVNRLDSSWELHTNDQTTLSARLLVGADGGNSWLRQQLKMSITETSYQQTAIVTTVHTEKPHQATAWQCFTARGPLAFLPLMDKHTSSIVWSIETAYCDELMALDEAAFCQALQQAFQYQLGKVTRTEKRFSFPLHRRHAQHYVQEGCALVGDAAHTIHPLAGQGINLGIQDVDRLATVISQQHQRRRDYASKYNLRSYERQRKSHNVAMLSSMDCLKYLFLTENTTLRWLRSTGLNLANQLGPVKRFFIKRAMGTQL